MNQPANKIGMAKAWVMEYLKDGHPRIAKEVEAAGLAAGHNQKTLAKAYKRAGGKPAFKTGFSPDWYWQLDPKLVVTEIKAPLKEETE